MSNVTGEKQLMNNNNQNLLTKILIYTSGAIALAAVLLYIKNDNKNSESINTAKQKVVKEVLAEDIQENAKNKSPKFSQEKLVKPATINSLEVVSIELSDLDRNLKKSKSSGFSKNYTELTEVLVEKSDEYKVIEINLENPLEKVSSLVLVGSKGESSLLSLQASDLSQEFSNKKDVLHANDWERLEGIKKPINKIKIKIKSLTDESSFKIYAQFIKGEQS